MITLTDEEKAILIKGKLMYFIQIPEELKYFMEENGGYELSDETLRDFKSKAKTEFIYNKICSCGLKFSKKDYLICPVCQNSKFSKQTIKGVELANSYLSNNFSELNLKKKFFDMKYSYQKVDNYKYLLFREKQVYTYNWLTDDFIIYKEDNLKEIGYILKKNNEFYVSKNNKKENIAVFAKTINQKNSKEFISMYNDLNKERPLPLLDLNGKQLSRLILDESSRIMSEYFHVYIDGMNIYYSYRDDSPHKKYDKALELIFNKNDLSYPLEKDMKNIYTATNLPKSIIKYIKKKFDKEKVVYSSGYEKNFLILLMDFFVETINNNGENSDIAIQLEEYFGYKYFKFKLNHFYILINQYGHNKKQLINYLQNIKSKQGISPFEAIVYYYDYINMSNEMNVTYTTYPKNLEKVHDIRMKDYKLIKSEIDNKKIVNNYNKIKLVNNDIDEKYLIVLPKEMKDLTIEGQLLNHCVASYVGRVVENNCLIYFLREKKSPNKPLVTIEYNIEFNKIVQTRGKFNRNIDKEERTAIKKWAKENNLLF